MHPARITLLATTLFATGSISAFAAGTGPFAQMVTAPPSLSLLGPPQASQPVEFDIILPLANAAALDALLAAQQDPTSPSYHHWLKPADFAAQFGPSPQSMATMAAALRMTGMQVTPQSRSLHVLGTAAQVRMALGAALMTAADMNGQVRLVSTTALSLPSFLSGTGAFVPAFRMTGFGASALMHNSTGGYMHNSTGGYMHNSTGGYGQGGDGSAGYDYRDLKQAYSYPSYQATVPGLSTRPDGTGATVAVVSASDILDSDVAALFDAAAFRADTGLSADPALAARRAVDGGNTFSAGSALAEEATLDVEQVLSGAPGSSVVLYDAPDLSDGSLVSVYTAIDNDDTADVVSMSYGQCELYYTAQYNNGSDQTAILRTFSELFKQGNAEGITFIAASGDSGGLGCISPQYFAGANGTFTTGVSVPAADPNVTAVGGTNLVIAGAVGGSDSSYVTENSWSDPEVPYDPFGLGTTVSGGVWGPGGGVSTLYARPAYQALVSTGSVAFRTLPDVGMQVGGCPDIAVSPCNGGDSSLDGSGNAQRSAFGIVFNGQWVSAIGTSAAAPEMASAVALMVQAQGRQGNLNPYLYTLAARQAAGGAAYFHQGIAGFNGVAATGGAYNYTSGNGTPSVADLIGFSSLPRAGAPGTASNP